MQHEYLLDQYENKINAGKVGDTIPIEANIYFLREKDTTGTFTFICGEDEIICDKIFGARQYFQSLSFNSASVLFAGIAGTSEGSGIFRSNYTVPSVGINYIPINAEASIDVQRTEVCPDCQTVTKQISQGASMTIQVYGVEINIEPPSAVLIYNVDDDGNGYSVKDLNIKYTIEPPDYNASTAYVAILKDNELIAFIPSERTGAGEVTLSEGFQFNMNSMYEAQVILNYGTGVEIRSEMVPLTVVKVEAVSVDANNPSYVKVNYRVIPADITLDTVTFSALGTTQTRSNESGEFYFTFNQNDLPLGSSTISLTATKYNRSITKEIIATRIEKRGPMEYEIAFGKIAFLVGQTIVIVTIPVNHDLFEIWHLFEYSAPLMEGSKTVWVGKSSVNLKTAETKDIPTEIGSWSEKHYYGDNQGTYLEQMMVDPSGPTLPPQGKNFRSKDSSNDSFIKSNNGLTGYAEIMDLQIKATEGMILWVPIPLIGNTTVDKPLD